MARKSNTVTKAEPITAAGDQPAAVADADTGGPLIEQGLSTADIRTVTCLIAGGRRRGGRRWEAGPTPVALSDLTGDEWQAVEADPMLSVSMPHPAGD